MSALMIKRNAQKGVGLIEVMIACFVIALGFLAVLKLQMVNMGNMGSAKDHYAASIVANDMADRIRANSASIASYDKMDSAPAATACTPFCAAVVDTDKSQWKTAVEAELPQGRSFIAMMPAVPPAVLPNKVTIYVCWSYKARGDGIKRDAVVVNSPRDACAKQYATPDWEGYSLEVTI